MINLLISLGATGVIYGLFALLLRPLEAIIPAVIALLIGYVLLARQTGKKINVIVQEVTKDVQGQRYQKAVDRLSNEGMALGRWQFLLKPQIHGHIGMIYYLQKQFNEARPHLEKSSNYHWLARGMYGAMLYREKNYDEMTKVFQVATKVNKSEALLWNVFAWCLWKNGDTTGAIKVLTDASQKVPSDERIKNNLLALQNGKKMKMKPYAEMWYQFHLEQVPGQAAPPGPKSFMASRMFRRRMMRT